MASSTPSHGTVEVSSCSLVCVCVHLACFDSCLTLWPPSPKEGCCFPDFQLDPLGRGKGMIVPCFDRKDTVVGLGPLPDLPPPWLSRLWAGPSCPFLWCLRCERSAQASPGWWRVRSRASPGWGWGLSGQKGTAFHPQSFRWQCTAVGRGSAFGIFTWG